MSTIRFDNEPANCNLFHERWPGAVTFFVDTTHAPNPPRLAPAIVCIDDFVVAQGASMVIERLLPILLLLVAIAVVVTRLPKVELGHSDP